MYIHIYMALLRPSRRVARRPGRGFLSRLGMVAIFCPFGLFCEIGVSLLSLQNSQKQPPRYFRGG